MPHVNDQVCQANDQIWQFKDPLCSGSDKTKRVKQIAFGFPSCGFYGMQYITKQMCTQIYKLKTLFPLLYGSQNFVIVGAKSMLTQVI